MPRPAAAKPKKGVNKRKLMNSMVNIPSTNPDPYYRYKMPALEIRINPSRVRTNNPQKEPITIPASTQLQNLPAVAKALNRPLEYITKFFELELEMQGELEDRQRWFKLLGGEVPEHELMLTLDKFIRRCRFLKEGASMPQSKGTVLKNANGFKNGVKVATAEELEEASDNDDDDDDEVQDWKLDTSDEAVAQRRLEELDLITRVEKIMNGGLGDKAKDPYKLFEEFVTTPMPSTGALPDKEEVLGRYYTLDLEKEGAIYTLEKLQHQQGQEKKEEGEETLQVSKRDDYDVMIQVLRDSLEREVIVQSVLDGHDDSDSDSDSDDDDSDEDSVKEE
ncbi:hypothetical protein BG006_000616 [Podila minutissima]|uniref:Translation initiation factor IF2/IF5 domain-containing protein n=1 Tax=Podila minutissima TaxID=64525 RepID=A0A9P5SQ44_9FUNG|nr:hypothetical protein BG006_000616 [Podila minutissima]